MNEELLTFKKFKDADVAKDIAATLTASDVYCEIDSNEKFFDPTFAHNPMQKDFRIMVSPPDFLRAGKVLEEYYDTQLDKIPSDYYLFDFTDRELFEIIEKQDEWGDLDNRLAQKLLRERGYDISAEGINELKKKRLKVLAEPEQSHPWLIFRGYAAAIMGGIFGIVLGWIMAYSKRTLPDGNQVFVYAENDRMHGKIIYVLGSAVLIFIIFRIAFLRTL